MKIVLASHNPGKMKEMSAILAAFGVELVLQSDLGTVSYTHLDVYKRQVQLCFDDAAVFHFDGDNGILSHDKIPPNLKNILYSGILYL